MWVLPSSKGDKKAVNEKSHEKGKGGKNRRRMISARKGPKNFLYWWCLGWALTIVWDLSTWAWAQVVSDSAAHPEAWGQEAMPGVVEREPLHWLRTQCRRQGELRVRTYLRGLTGVTTGSREDAWTLVNRNKVIVIYSISPKINTVNNQNGIISMWKFSTWNDLFSLVRCFDLITSWNAANICKIWKVQANSWSEFCQF